VEAHITLILVIEREDDQYVAACNELEISSFGPTVEAAKDHLVEAIGLYLDVLEEDGERERIFRERGIVVHHGSTANYRLDAPVGAYVVAHNFPVKTLARA
jgi:predicted RNase H-like HicB family nuclease